MPQEQLSSLRRGREVARVLSAARSLLETAGGGFGRDSSPTVSPNWQTLAGLVEPAPRHACSALTSHLRGLVVLLAAQPGDAIAIAGVARSVLDNAAMARWLTDDAEDIETLLQRQLAAYIAYLDEIASMVAEISQMTGSGLDTSENEELYDDVARAVAATGGRAIRQSPKPGRQLSLRATINNAEVPHPPVNRKLAATLFPLETFGPALFGMASGATHGFAVWDILAADDYVNSRWPSRLDIPTFKILSGALWGAARAYGTTYSWYGMEEAELVRVLAKQQIAPLCRRWLSNRDETEQTSDRADR